MFFPYVKSRPDIGHLFPMLLPAIVLLPYLVQNFLEKHQNNYLFKGVVYTTVFLLVSSFAVGSLKLITCNLSPASSDLVPLEVKRGKGIYVWLQEPGANMQQAVKFIQENVPENEKIFVANSRHDKSDISDVMFYFLSERDSATRYFVLKSGLVTNEFVQSRIVKDLIRQNVKYIVVWHGDKEAEKMESSGVHILDNFIQENYKLVKDFGEYSILKKIEK